MDLHPNFMPSELGSHMVLICRRGSMAEFRTRQTAYSIFFIFSAKISPWGM